MANRVTEFLSGLGTFAVDIAKDLEKQQREERLKELEKKQVAEKEQLITELYGSLEKAKEEIAKLEKTVVTGYSMETLAAMSINQLRAEVYSIYQENKGNFLWDDEKYELSEEARKLYNQTVYSQARYKAQLIKFLYEKGKI